MLLTSPCCASMLLRVSVSDLVSSSPHLFVFSGNNARTLLVRDHARCSRIRGDQQDRSLFENEYSTDDRMFDVSSQTWKWVDSIGSVRRATERRSFESSEHVRRETNLSDLCRVVCHRREHRSVETILQHSSTSTDEQRTRTTLSITRGIPSE
jgi:hypothetical protein